jgi:hypothetical protein
MVITISKTRLSLLPLLPLLHTHPKPSTNPNSSTSSPIHTSRIQRHKNTKIQLPALHPPSISSHLISPLKKKLKIKIK